MGRLSIPQETTLFDLLRQCFDNFVNIFAIKDEDNILLDTSNLERVLSSIFDTESRAFVTEKSLRIVDGLNDHDKVCLFVQAVTGMGNRLPTSQRVRGRNFPRSPVERTPAVL